MRIRDLAQLGLCFAAFYVGCAAPPPNRAVEKAITAEARQPAPVSPTTSTSLDRPPLPLSNAAAATTPAPPATGVPAFPAAPPSQEQAAALDATIAELRKLGAIDPAAEEQLRADLRQTDPALWPRLLQYFRASRAGASSQPASAATPGASPESAHPSTPLVIKPAETVSNPVPAETPLPTTLAWKENPPPAKEEATQSTLQPASTKAPAPASAPAEAGEQDAVGKEPKAEDAAAPSEKGLADPDVKQASFEQPKPSLTWEEHLQAAIRALEEDSSSTPKTAAELTRHADLRLLYLVAGRRDDALRPIAGISPAQQDFWSKELYGLATYLDAQRITDGAQRAAVAKEHFSEAVAQLGELGTLVVRNLAFCTKVSSYGVFTRFDSDAFTPGQEVLLYAEVENFKSEPTDQGFHTVLRSSYQILDSRGQRVDQRDFSTTEEHCLNPRRDFFIRYFLHIPQRIYDGKYTLQLTIEDTLSQKIGQSSLEFTVKGAQE
jgi:hypothetical protein